VGQALASMAHHIPRESLFITSKLWNTFHNPDDIEPTLDQTLSRLQTNYLDLYLIHWPVAQHKDGLLDYDMTENPVRTWKTLESLVRMGKIRNLGVSKFVSRLLSLLDLIMSLLSALIYDDYRTLLPRVYLFALW
jgi:diketogulonate reductase-like aldo/keto reductase